MKIWEKILFKIHTKICKRTNNENLVFRITDYWFDKRKHNERENKNTCQ